MQRWMAAKMILARSHGTAMSGAGRATGDVWDDRPRGAEKKEDRGFHPVKKRPSPNVVLKREKPTAWGKGRAARRQEMGVL